MQTKLSTSERASPEGREAERILRACVHCGFCNATCPTYQVLGDELDGPRGRIYLIKQLLEGGEVGANTRLHLDRCLTCRACETTCPSGVEYAHLLDIGRQRIATRAGQRGWLDMLKRYCLARVLPRSVLFTPLLRIGQGLRPFLPGRLRRRIPARVRTAPYIGDGTVRTRRMLLLEGCVQPALAPAINARAQSLLAGLGIDLLSLPEAGCCGAVSHHLDDHDQALSYMRRNIDAWWPLLQSGAEAIISTASGCGLEIREYGWLLREDPEYADKAGLVSERVRDLAEVLAREAEGRLRPATGIPLRIAFQSPCTLQHGLGLNGVVESLLGRAGFELTAVADAHLCCGSAGTYSLTQTDISKRLREDKLRCLQAGAPKMIATANIGCLTHLATESPVPVRHWVELLSLEMD